MAAEKESRVREVLSYISPNCDRYKWAEVICPGVKSALGPAGNGAWHDWSSGGDSYNHAEAENVWRSWGEFGKRTFASVVALAKEEGYNPKGQYVPPTEEQRAAAMAKAIEGAKAAAIEDQKKADKARERGERMWQDAKDRPATTAHLYVKNKGIQPHGLRIGTWKKLASKPGEPKQFITIENVLLVPIYDKSRKLHGVQGITVEGDKFHLFGVAKRGNFSPLWGKKKGGGVILAEGWATAASIHEATGSTVFCCFDAGNVLRVAKAIYDAKKVAMDMITIAADNDTESEAEGKGNEGMRVAFEASRLYGMRVAVPPPGDFNDLVTRARQSGMAEDKIAAMVRRLIDGATVQTEPYKPTLAPVVAASQEQAEAGEGAPGGADGSNVVHTAPSLDERPCYRVFDDWWTDGERRRKGGIWHFGCKTGRGEGAEPVATEPKFVCGPLHVLAQTHAPGEKEQYGRLLRFKTTKGNWQVWAMPQEHLAGDAKELRAVLLDRGLGINPMARLEFVQFLSNAAPNQFIDCTSHTGWAGAERKAYVLPSAVIGPAAAEVVFQSAYPGEDVYTTAGTLEGWRDGVAAMAVGNSMLTVAIATGASGPLLGMIDAESGGFHLVGDSSTGKSTQLHAACSLWGAPEKFKLSWRATSNGLEGAAAYRNDALLALDEISECDPSDVDAIVYMLSNGTGKQRASRTGAARAPVRFRVSVLSSGERTVETAMAGGGIQMKAGQAVRLVDLHVRGRFGAWNELHGRADGTSFSNDLKAAANAHHGHAARAFLERLTHDDAAAIRARFDAIKQRFEAEVQGGQAKRVAARFAAAALSGELLTAYGLTGWPAGWAAEAALAELHGWQDAKGKTEGNAEQKQIAESVESFIQTYGESRFDSTTASDAYARPALKRAGWHCFKSPTDPTSIQYLFTPAGLREAIGSHDFNRALNALDAIGALDKSNTNAAPGKGVKSQPKTIHGKSERVYFVNYAKLTGFNAAA